MQEIDNIDVIYVGFAFGKVPQVEAHGIGGKILASQWI